MKCKKPSINFNVKYFPRSIYSIDCDSYYHGIKDVYIHFQNPSKNRPPYILAYTKELDYQIAIDLNLKMYRYKEIFTKEKEQEIFDFIKKKSSFIKQFWFNEIEEDDFLHLIGITDEPI